MANMRDAPLLDFKKISMGKKKSRFLSLAFFSLIGFLLIYSSVATLLSIFQITATENFSELFKNQSLIYFLLGSFLLLFSQTLPFLKKPSLYFYVLGHELTHALLCLISFHKIKGMKVSAQGGHVITTHSNLLICLSPYILPFWTFVWFFISFFLPEREHSENLLFLLLGFTFSFHWFWTLKMSFPEQSDLQEYGFLFSIFFITQINLFLVAFFLSILLPSFSLESFLSLFLENLLRITHFFQILMEGKLP